MDDKTDTPGAIIDRIRLALDVKDKAEIAGLRREPFVADDMKQECANCIYYLPRRRHCDQPELDFAVNPDWWCLLWRC